MSWFSFNVGELAKNALNEAQKKIDKALDIEAKGEAKTSASPALQPMEAEPDKSPQQSSKGLRKSQSRPKKDATGLKAKKVNNQDADDFFSSWDDETLNAKSSPRIKNIPSVTTNQSNLQNDRVSDSDIEVLPPGKYLSDDGASNEKYQTPIEFVDVPLADSKDLESCQEGDEKRKTQNFLVTQNKTQDNMISLSKIESDDPFIDRPECCENESMQDPLDEVTHCDNTVGEHSSTHLVLEGNKSIEAEPRLDDTPIVETNDTTNEGTSDAPCQNLVHENDFDATSEISDSPEHIEREIDNDLPEPIELGKCKSDITIGTDNSLKEPNSMFTVDSSSQNASNATTESGDKFMVLSEKMEVYEQQLLTLSQKNAALSEENDNLKSEISRAFQEGRQQIEKDMAEVNESLQTSENSCKILKEEKDNLIKQFNVLKSQLASRMTNEQVQNAIAEKEESIKGLMEEGEVLAKKHLQQNNLIKKLKSQGQERETELKSLKEKVTKFEEENARLKGELKIAQGQGKEQMETSMRISDAYEQREKQSQILQEKLAQSEEIQRTLQVNLDSAYKEIGDLHKQIAEQESKFSSEWKAKEADLLRENDVEKKKISSDQDHQRQLLMIQIMELSNSISRAEANAARKEDDHRREIQELLQRIQESEGRNQDLSDNVTNVTRPLLRQIENLQSTHATQQRSWNALEKTLNYRLGEAQTELLEARDNERIAQNAAIESKSKAQAYEKQIETNRKLISKQENEIETLHRQLEERKIGLKEVTKELEELKTIHKEILHKSRKERLFLENQLQMEKVRSEAERKKHVAQQESFQKERDKLMWSRSEITSISSNLVAETESVSSADAFQGSDGLERHPSSSSLPGLTNQLSFEGGRALSMSNILENLQTQVKLREGEIVQLRGDINTLERTRSSMAEEIVRLTNLNEDMEGVSRELQETHLKLSEVEGRYSAILTMYGEKEEENEELKMDLADVKAMYRQQINDLLKSDAS